MASSMGHELPEVLGTADQLTHGDTAHACFVEKRQEGNNLSGPKQEAFVMGKTGEGSSPSDLESNEQSQYLASIVSTGFTCRRRRTSHRGTVNNDSNSPIILGSFSSYGKHPRSTLGNDVSQDQGYAQLERTDSSLRDSQKSPQCHEHMEQQLKRQLAVDIHNRMATADGNDQLNVDGSHPVVQRDSRRKGKEILSDISRQPRRKMLVHNGYISPKNIVAGSNTLGKAMNRSPEAGHRVNDRGGDDAFSDTNTSIYGNNGHQRIVDSFPAARREGRRKDKEHVAGHMFEGGEDSGARALRTRKRVRANSMSSEEGNAVLVHENSPIPRLAGEETWQSTYEDIASLPPGSNVEISSSLGRRDQGDNTQLTSRFVGLSSIDQGETMWHEADKPMGWSSPGGILRPLAKRRRMRRTSTDTCTGQGSSSNCDASPDVVYLRTSRPLRNNSYTRRIDNVAQASGCDIAQAPSHEPIEVDSLESPVIRDSPTIVSSNTCPSDQEAHARAQQIARDEMLARQLQEEFEGEVFRGGDLRQHDADIALTLQQEENGIVTYTSTSGMSLPRSFVTGGSRRREPFRSLGNIITRSGSRVGTAASTSVRRRAPALGRVGRFRGAMDSAPAARPFDGTRVHFPSYMNLDMRMDLLEAMERAVEGHVTHGHLAQLDRDFNANDYEMLLALDDSNDHHRGASLQQIDRLPVSTLQPTDISEEVCSVCLEIPTAGEVIRHLLCMHRFHKECIDPWLTIQACCPVCKSSIETCP